MSNAKFDRRYGLRRPAWGGTTVPIRRTSAERFIYDREGTVSRIITRNRDTRPKFSTAAFSSLCATKEPGRICCPDGLKGELRQLKKNKDLVVAGRHYALFYLNHDGWLFRYKILHNGNRQIVDFILPGQIFGLQACFFKASLYSIATVTAASVSSIPLEMIDNVFDQNPRLAEFLFWSAVSEAAIVGEHLIDTARRSAYERVSHLFLELFVRLKSAGQTDGQSFSMPLTQELIGDALGLTTVHVNRTLRALREDGLIKMSNRRVTIVDFDGLSLLCDFDKSYLGETARALQNETPRAERNKRFTTDDIFRSELGVPR